VTSRPQKKREEFLFERQKQVLALLYALGGNATRLDFQKLLFLYCQEPVAKGIYEFVPYKFGAFSFTSYADCRKLVERGLFIEPDNRWELTEAGTARAAKLGRLHSALFVQRLGDLLGDALVAETYIRFPYFAIRSEIAKRVLRGQLDALKQIDAARPTQRGPGLASIGYEGRTLEGYLNKLIGSGIGVLCDVRLNPISRKYGFSKSTLENACKGVGIQYRHLPELGIASERRQALTTQEDYDALFTDYVRVDLPRQGPALAKIRGWIESGKRVALTCFEREPASCHRLCVAEALEIGSNQSIVVQHL